MKTLLHTAALLAGAAALALLSGSAAAQLSAEQVGPDFVAVWGTRFPPEMWGAWCPIEKQPDSHWLYQERGDCLDNGVAVLIGPHVLATLDEALTATPIAARPAIERPMVQRPAAPLKIEPVKPVSQGDRSVHGDHQVGIPGFSPASYGGGGMGGARLMRAGYTPGDE
jgi:hypothetical protein